MLKVPCFYCHEHNCKFNVFQIQVSEKVTVFVQNEPANLMVFERTVLVTIYVIILTLRHSNYTNTWWNCILKFITLAV